MFYCNRLFHNQNLLNNFRPLILIWEGLHCTSFLEQPSDLLLDSPSWSAIDDESTISIHVTFTFVIALVWEWMCNIPKSVCALWCSKTKGCSVWDLIHVLHELVLMSKAAALYHWTGLLFAAGWIYHSISRRGVEAGGQGTGFFLTQINRT